MNIIFFGTSQFGIETLEILHKNYNVIKVITPSPKPSGRGYVLNKNPIHKKAEELGISVLNTSKPTTHDIVEKFDIGVVVSYGAIISKDVLNLAKYGFLNLHPSDLPKFRGAAPIERTIESGEVRTRICIIKMTPKLDDGDILCFQNYTIQDDENSLDLHNKFAKIGANLLPIAIQKIIQNVDEFEKQDNSNFTYAKKISKDELFLNEENTANLPALAVINKIRAFVSYGCCFIMHEGKRIKILKARISGKQLTKIDLKCQNGFVSPLIIKPEGKDFIQSTSFTL